MNTEALKQKVIECLQGIFDPEIPVNIYEMGLIYEVEILPINNVHIIHALDLSYFLIYFHWKGLGRRTCR